jgi:hypothetical protein
LRTGHVRIGEQRLHALLIAAGSSGADEGFRSSSARH